MFKCVPVKTPVATDFGGGNLAICAEFVEGRFRDPQPSGCFVGVENFFCILGMTVHHHTAP
jgi:hypothetical protein